MRRVGNECSFSCDWAVVLIHDSGIVGSGSNLMIRVASRVLNSRYAITRALPLRAMRE